MIERTGGANVKFPKISLHNHTCYCDGENTPEEMVLAAIEAGVETIGFSGHSCTSFDLSYCMTRENTAKYREEILRLREKYRDRIQILLGIERDFYADPDDAPYDYVIGSVHYIIADDGAICAIDESREIVLRDVKEHFGGNIYRWTRRYYETLAQVVEKTNCNVVGHFDLVRKYNGDGTLFDSELPDYRLAVLDAMEALTETGVIFEINTSAMKAGGRRTPYPSPDILDWLARHGAKTIITSDAHRAGDILFGFEDAALYAKSCGIGGFTVPRNGKWVTVPIGRE